MVRILSLLFVLFLLSVSPVAPSGIDAISFGGPIAPTFDGLDLDSDHIDDRLVDLEDSCVRDGRLGINVHLDRRPSDLDRASVLSALSAIGADPILIKEGKLVNALYLDVDAYSARDLRKVDLPDHVRFLELRPPMVPTLDISAPTVRAKSSDLYSPSTAQDLGIDGTGINIAILDTGVDNTFHETFRGRAVYGIDFTGPTVVYGADPDDIDGHGTHVAGIALGDGGSSAKYQGMAPAAGLVDIRIARLIGDTSGNLDSAFEWLIENHDQYNVRVVSVSFGSTVNSPGTDTSSTLANSLVDEGVVVVVAAGNNGVPGFPSPASADKVITVAASDDKDSIDRSDDQVGTYSNYGPRDSDGDQDQRDELKPDILAPGTNIMSAEHNTVGAYITKTGTSMSCPHVSGIAALMLEADPDLSPTDLKAIIRATGEQKAPPSYPSLDQKYDIRTGWGYVDSYGSVKRAMDLRSSSLSAPGEAPAGSMVPLEIAADYSKTEWNVGDEKMVLSLRTPDNFGKPESISITSGAPLSSQRIVGPQKDGSSWLVEAEIQYNNTIEGIAPKLTEKVRAPKDLGTTGKMIGGVQIGEVHAKDMSKNVTIVENVSPSDLSITPFAIWFSDGLPDGGQNVDITVRVNNTNKGLASGCLIRVIDGPERTGEVIGERNVDIPGDGYDVVTVQWEANPGVHAITAVADPDNVIAESDETNNSAERPITVRGLNPPPMARITADTNRTTIMTDVTFDASASSDTNLRGGNVVSYRFYFGDGAESGWINSSIYTHEYTEPGIYTASVVVRDNGGAQSVNDASVDVEITDLSYARSELFLDPGFALKEKGVASGQIAFGAGGGIPLGTWTSNAYNVSTSLLVNAEVQLFIDSRGANISARAVLSDDEGAIGEATSGPVNMPDGTILQFNITVPTFDHEVRFDGRLYLQVTADSDGSAKLVMGKGLSRIIIYPRAVPNALPVADAGMDMEVKALQSIIFEGSGSDADGSIVDARWDVNGDGTFEAEGASALSFTYPGYSLEGNFTAMLEVRDDKGWWGRDTASVRVWPEDHNFAPKVTIDLIPGANLSGVIGISGRSSDDVSVLLVEILVRGEGGEVLPWTDVEGTDPWRYDLDTTRFANGAYTVSARSYDGDAYSSVAGASVVFSNPTHAPEVLDFAANPDEVALDGETSIIFTVDVRDADLPDDELTAYLDLSVLGGGSSVVMDEYSKAGKEVSFRKMFVPSSDISVQSVLVGVRVVDSRGGFDTSEAMVGLTRTLSVTLEIRPGSVRSGSDVVIEARVEGIGSGSQITANSTGFISPSTLQDDGADPDRSRGDGIFSGRAKVVSNPGKYPVTVEVRDSKGTLIGKATGEITVTLAAESGGSGPLWIWFAVVAILVVVASIAGVIIYTINARTERKKVVPDAVELPVKKVVVAAVMND